MPLLVEPIEGPELDRVITVLLNATGAVHQLVETEVDAGYVGVGVVDRVADRLRSILVLFEEHRSDEELAEITEFLAIATIMIAEHCGFDAVFHPDRGPGPDGGALL